MSISSNRADAGVLAMVWSAMAKNRDVDLHVLFTGAHCRPDASLPEMPVRSTVHRGGADLGGAEAGRAAAAMDAIQASASALYAKLQPDIVLATGDRLDMIPAVIATLPINAPVAHLHGGELSQGAIDDRIRHALTKLSHLHFAATAEAAGRLSAMGEESWRIHVTGAPGLDTLLAQLELSAAEFAGKLGFGSIEQLRMVTVHPETNSPDPSSVLDPVLAALDARPAPTLITAPNSDPGGEAMRRACEQFAVGRDWVRYRDTLGSHLYANALRHAAVLVGNSSSGIIEAGLFGTPVINVGRRQDGRTHGQNVVDVAAERSAILAVLDRLPGRFPVSEHLYGDGKASGRIAAVLADLPARDRLMFKRFSDTRAEFSAPWSR